MKGDAHGAHRLAKTGAHLALAGKHRSVGHAGRATRPDVRFAGERECHNRPGVIQVVRHPADTDDIDLAKRATPPVMAVVLASAVNVEAALGEAEGRVDLPAQVNASLEGASVGARLPSRRAAGDHPEEAGVLIAVHKRGPSGGAPPVEWCVPLLVITSFVSGSGHLYSAKTQAPRVPADSRPTGIAGRCGDVDRAEKRNDFRRSRGSAGRIVDSSQPVHPSDGTDPSAGGGAGSSDDDFKAHFSVVENRRVSSGKTVQRTVVCLSTASRPRNSIGLNRRCEVPPAHRCRSWRRTAPSPASWSSP